MLSVSIASRSLVFHEGHLSSGGSGTRGSLCRGRRLEFPSASLLSLNQGLCTLRHLFLEGLAALPQKGSFVLSWKTVHKRDLSSYPGRRSTKGIFRLTLQECDGHYSFSLSCEVVPGWSFRKFGRLSFRGRKMIFFFFPLFVEKNPQRLTGFEDSRL